MKQKTKNILKMLAGHVLHTIGLILDYAGRAVNYTGTKVSDIGSELILKTQYDNTITNKTEEKDEE